MEHKKYLLAVLEEEFIRANSILNGRTDQWQPGDNDWWLVLVLEKELTEDWTTIDKKMKAVKSIKRDGNNDTPVALLRAAGTLDPSSKRFSILMDILNSNERQWRRYWTVETIELTM
jgi:hypothetical protein